MSALYSQRKLKTPSFTGSIMQMGVLHLFKMLLLDKVNGEVDQCWTCQPHLLLPKQGVLEYIYWDILFMVYA